MNKQKQLYTGIIALVVALLVCLVLAVLIIVRMRSKDDAEPQDSVKTVVVDTVVVTDTVEVKKPEKSRLNVKPLTQYALVEVGDYGVGFRKNDKIASILKGIGFKAKSYNVVSEGEYEELGLEASRAGNNGTTTVRLTYSEDILCTIHFANQEEVDAFVDSMKKSKYSQEGTLFSHPQNNMGKIYVRVNGLNVKIISPFEMLPNNF